MRCLVLPQQSTFNAEPNVLKTFQNQWLRTTPQERDLLSALAPVMLGTGSAGMTMINQTFKTNASIVAEMAENYNRYTAKELTKGQYDYQRRKSLSKLKAKLGPTNLLLNGTQSPNEVLRISRKKGNVPTQALTQQINRMGSLAKIASRGGVVLSVVGLGVACHEIASTNNVQKKNEILVESLGGFTGGMLYGGATTLAVLLMATPVGWVGALVIGAGGVLAGTLTGYGSKSFYTTHLSHINFHKVTKLDQLCK